MRPNDAGNQRPSRPLTADQAWQITTARAAECVLFFDFDGVVAPVGDDPNAVRKSVRPSRVTAISSGVDRLWFFAAGSNPGRPASRL